MPCYDPVPCWMGESGKLRFTYPFPPDREHLRVPCGGCVGCRLDQSRDWAVRSVHEAQLHERSSFITLTYRDEDLPAGNTLVKRDMQLFFKRYRKEFGKLKYLYCGEYGAEKGRPHYHALIFGHDFLATDKQCRLDRKNHLEQPLFRSPDLQELWGHGFCLTGAVTFQSSAYVGRYVMKKVTGANAKDHYRGRVPEYVQPSTGGRNGRGLSFHWFQRFWTDVYPSDFVVCDGRKYRPPRYYDKLLREQDESLYELVKRRRQERARNDEDQSWARLEVREKVKQKQFERLVRDLE